MPRRPLQARVDLLPMIDAAIDGAQLTAAEAAAMLLGSPAADMRRAAVERLNDTARLGELERSEPSLAVRAAAKARLRVLGGD